MNIFFKIANMQLKFKLAIVFSILFVTAFLLTTYINYYFSTRAIKDEVTKYSTITAGQVTEKVDLYIGDLSKLTDMIANEIMGRKILIGSSTYDQYNDYQAVTEIIANYYNIARDIKNIENVFLYKSDGKLLYQDVYDAQLLSDDLSKNLWYKNAKNIGQVNKIIDIVTLPNSENKPGKHLVLYRKIYNDMAQYLGIVGFIVDIEKSDKLFGKIEAEGNAKIILFDDKGAVIYNNNVQVGNDFSYLIMYKIGNSSDGLTTLSIDRKQYIVIHKKSNLTNWIAAVIVPEGELFNKMYMVRDITIVITFVFAFAIISTIIGISSLMTRSIKKLSNAMLRVENGDLTVRVDTEMNDEIGILSKGFNKMLQRINGLIENLVRERTSKKDAQLKSLLSQINPHFLFNTLETIRMRSLVLGEKGTAELIENLSNLFNMSMNWKEDFITIRSEIEHVKSYLSILNIRYNNRFEMNLSIDEDIMECKMPKFILQPLVENSITHGFEGVTIKGTLEISFKKAGECIKACVADDGIGIYEDKLKVIKQYLEKGQENEDEYDYPQGESNGIGLKNVNDRLVHYFGKEFGLSIDNVKEEGTCVCFTIPVNRK